jgi:DNA invertase Pin-like site-specific DNA recombinase
MSSTKRAALYVRVSRDSQTVENQIRELRQVAGRRGWDVVEVYSDAGISGAKGRNGRPGLDSMLKDANRRKFDIVMAWAIDRLGRSLIDLLDTIQHLEACGVDLYLDQQAIDTTTPMGKLVFQVTGAFAEFERTMIRQRVKAGLKRAVAQGVKLGRPKIDSATERKVRKQLAKGVGILKLAKSLGIGTGTVQRISNELGQRKALLYKAGIGAELAKNSSRVIFHRIMRTPLGWDADPPPVGSAFAKDRSRFRRVLELEPVRRDVRAAKRANGVGVEHIASQRIVKVEGAGLVRGRLSLDQTRARRDDLWFCHSAVSVDHHGGQRGRERHGFPLFHPRQGSEPQ